MEEQKRSPLKRSVSDRLFKSRIIIINGGITQDLAGDINSQLLALTSQSNDPITMFIHSQGGHVESGDSIHDMIQFIEAPVRMVGNGWVASAGALIYVASPLENRYCLPNTRFLLHQPSGGVRGTGSDIAIEAEEIVKMRERLNKIISEATGQPLEKVEEDTERNYWLTAEEAIEYGLVNSVVKKISEVR
jgi:ATP-dependent Clp protease protease subunit